MNVEQMIVDGGINKGSLQNFYEFIGTNRDAVNQLLDKEYRTLQWIEQQKNDLTARLNQLQRLESVVLKRAYNMNDIDAAVAGVLLHYPVSDVTLDNKNERTATFTSNLRPNLHLDKTLLNSHELAELFMYGAELLDSGIDYDKILDLKKTIIPAQNNIIHGVVDLISNAVMGQNNYIGPYKTGNVPQDMTIEQIVSTIPVLSQDDARARAHDVLLALSDDKRIDSVLNGISRAAQVFRPIFTDSTPRRGVGNFDLLKLSGDVEQNPGPKEWNFENGKMVMDEITNIISNPTSAISYLNQLTINDLNDWMMYTSRTHNVTLRSALDNGVQRALASNNWQQLAGVHIADTTGGAGSLSFGRRQHNWTIEPRTYKTRSGSTKLGTGLNSALQAFGEFLAAERTINNIVAGDNLLGIWQRVSNVDFGMYLGMLKLLCYNYCSYTQFGDLTTGVRADAEVRLRKSGAGVRTPVTQIYPLSDNIVAAGTVINASFLTLSQYVQVLRGQLVLAIDLNDANSVAPIIHQHGLPDVANTLLILTKLEWPFAWSTSNPATEIVTFSVGNGLPVVTPDVAGGVPVTMMTRLTGAKYTVIFIKSDDFIDPIGVGTPLVPTINVPQYPAVVNVFPALQDYVEFMSFDEDNPIIGYSEIFDYWTKMMDIDDWKAAMFCFANMCQWKSSFFEYRTGLGAAAANLGGPWMGTVAPVPPYFDPSIVTAGLAAANVTQARNAATKRPSFTAMGIPSFYFGPYNAAGTPNVGPVTGKISDSPPLAYFAIFNKMLAKDTLQGTGLTGAAKANPKKIWYAAYEVAERILQMTHHWFQNERITNRMLFAQEAQVVNNRINIWLKLNSLWTKWLTEFCGGIVPLRFAPPVNVDLVGALPVGGTGNFLDFESFYNSMVNLHNDLLDGQGEKGVFPFVPQPQMKFDKVAEPWGVFQTAQTTVNGVLILGNNSVISPDEFAIVDGRNKITYDMLFAVMQTGHMINPAILSRLLDCVPILKNTRGLYLCRPQMCFFKRFLQWTGGNSTSDDFRFGTPAVMGMFVPHFLPEYDAPSGSKLLLAFGNSNTIQNIRGFMSIDGTGSSNFQFTEAATDSMNTRLAIPPGESFF